MLDYSDYVGLFCLNVALPDAVALSLEGSADVGICSKTHTMGFRLAGHQPHSSLLGPADSPKSSRIAFRY